MADTCQCGAKNKAGHFERIAKQRAHKHEYTGPGKHTLRDQGGGKK